MTTSASPSREFERLRRALSSVDPGSLIVVTLTSPDERRRLADRLASALPEQRIGVYDYASEPDERLEWNPARLLRDAADAPPLNDADVLVVVGLESRFDVGVGTGSVQGLTDLNSAREFLTTLEKVLVLVVSPDFADTVSRHAPDLRSWRLYEIPLDGLWPIERDLARLSRRLFSLFKLGPSLRRSLDAEGGGGNPNARLLLAWDSVARGELAAANALNAKDPLIDYLAGERNGDWVSAGVSLKERLETHGQPSFFQSFSAAVFAAWLDELKGESDSWRHLRHLTPVHERQRTIIELTVALLLLWHGRAERVLTELPTLNPNVSGVSLYAQSHAARSDASRLLGRRRLPDGAPLGPSFDDLDESAQSGVLPW